MSDFDKLWSIVVSPPVWDGIVRGIRFSFDVFKDRSLSLVELLDEGSLNYLSDVLNAIPEDVKSSEANVKRYLLYKKSFDPISDLLL